jgi:hypothetical protein
MYTLLQLRISLFFPTSMYSFIVIGTFLCLGAEVDTDTVHTVSLVLILFCSKALALEDVSQMPSAVVAHDFGPTAIRPLSHGTGDSVAKGGPSTVGLELVLRFVERRITAYAVINAGALGGFVFI